jgi:hypothetical protein
MICQMLVRYCSILAPLSNCNQGLFELTSLERKELGHSRTKRECTPSWQQGKTTVLPFLDLSELHFLHDTMFLGHVEPMHYLHRVQTNV